LSKKFHIFNSISDWICIYLKIQNKKIQSINFWVINRIFSIQFLIAFAFILKIQNKKIISINFWATNLTFSIHFLIEFAFIINIQKRKFNHSTFESQIADFQFNWWSYLHLFEIFKTKKSYQSLLSQKSHIFNSISDYIYIYYQNPKKKIHSINFWAINRTFSIQVMIVLAFN
jgi:hypothetical protein